MTLENQRERAQGRLFSSLLLTDSGSFFLFLCSLMVRSYLLTCKYFIPLLPTASRQWGSHEKITRSTPAIPLMDRQPLLSRMQGHAGQPLPLGPGTSPDQGSRGSHLDGRDGTESQIYHISLIIIVDSHGDICCPISCHVGIGFPDDGAFGHI